ncbi:MAG: hypothetical protein GC154_03695 [bacterium]|nr:hypothetical protein [bacterium]
MRDAAGERLSEHFARLLRAGFEERAGSIAALRERIHAGERELLPHAARTLDELSPQCLQTVLSQFTLDGTVQLAAMAPLFAERHKQTLLEELHSERLTPDILIRPASSVAPPLVHHALLIECMPHAMNDLFPPMLDAALADHGLHQAERRVMAVHESWLTDSFQARRGIFYDLDRDVLIETDFEPPAPLASVQFLCMTPGVHRRMSRRAVEARVFQVNSFDASDRMDDKYACFQRWREMDVLTPDAALIASKDAASQDALREALAALTAGRAEKRTVVVQPNRGTEGRGVRVFHGPGGVDDFILANPDLAAHVIEIARGDDVLLREGIEGARAGCSPGGEMVCFDVRMYCAHGEAESGFFQLAPAASLIASPSRGGRIVEWKPGTVLKGFTGETAIEIRPGGEYWRFIRAAAERAAAAFPEVLMAGIDLRLGPPREDGEPFSVWALDINPRPAGEAHARYAATGEPGVTQRLWAALPPGESGF